MSSDDKPPLYPSNIADPTPIAVPQHPPSHKVQQTVGKRKKLTGNPKFKGNGKRVDAELYEAIWEAWRDGNRSISRLAGMYQMSWSTIKKLVTKGHYDRGFPAFVERLKVWEAAAASAKVATKDDTAKRKAEEWDKATTEHLKLTNATRYGLAHLIRKAVEATQKVEFTKTRKRRVIDSNGNATTIDEEVPISAVTMAEVWRTISTSVETVSRIESFWRGGPTSKSEVLNGALTAIKAFQNLTPEELNYIIESGGDLPPGVTHEDLFGAGSVSPEADDPNAKN